MVFRYLGVASSAETRYRTVYFVWEALCSVEAMTVVAQFVIAVPMHLASISTTLII